MKLYAKSGQWITCENGHRICQIVRDLYIGDLGWAACIGNWQENAFPEPALGQTICPRCGICGGWWSGGGWEFHFEDGGWRLHDWRVPQPNLSP